MSDSQIPQIVKIVVNMSDSQISRKVKIVLNLSDFQISQIVKIVLNMSDSQIPHQGKYFFKYVWLKSITLTKYDTSNLFFVCVLFLYVFVLSILLYENEQSYITTYFLIKFSAPVYFSCTNIFCLFLYIMRNYVSLNLNKLLCSILFFNHFLIATTQSLSLIITINSNRSMHCHHFFKYIC